MSDFSRNTDVALQKCKEYDLPYIKNLISKQINDILGESARSFFYGKNVMVKPNLLLKYTPDKCATTNPIVVRAALEVIRGYSPASLILAESPGGPYNATALRGIYKVSGMEKAAEGLADLNYDTSFVEFHAPENSKSKIFNIIKPVKEADVIVNLCKLKTHSLAVVTGASKNYFGLVPGIQKFEFHARYASSQKDFLEALCELTASVIKEKSVFNIMDAVYGMEGNGPSGGEVRKFGFIASSLNPFALDLLAFDIIGAASRAPMIQYAQKKGYCPKSTDELTVIGDNPDELRINDLVFADTDKLNFLRHIPKILGPRPAVNGGICIGCGECVRSCPAHTIKLENGHAKINTNKCIRCYCCQELCRYKAIKIKKLLIYDRL